jgi:hypothetical protein
MRMVLSAGLMLLASQSLALAGSTDDLKKLGDEQLGTVSGGQAVVQAQGVAVLSGGPTTSTNQGAGSSGSPSPAFPMQGATTSFPSAQPFGLNPMLGNFAGSSFYTRYGN